MMESQPKELSIAIIKHRVKRFYPNPGLIDKIILAAKEQKPGLIITPQYSFLTEGELVDSYLQIDRNLHLAKEAPLKTLITARDIPSVIISKPELNPLEGIDYKVLVYPHAPERFLGLDLLITMGENTWQDFVKDTNSLRRGGYLIRITNSVRNAVIKLNQDKCIEVRFPVRHNNMNIYDWYNLKLE